MKFTNVLTLILILMFALTMQMPQPVSAAPRTSAKYVKTAEDTLTINWSAVTDIDRQFLITNESDSAYLNVYFSNDTGGKLTTSFVRIAPKKTFYFNESTKKIFRSASKDSIYSQVIFGKVTIGSKAVESESLNAAGIISQDKYSEAELTGRKFPINAESKNDNYSDRRKIFKLKMYLCSDLTY